MVPPARLARCDEVGERLVGRLTALLLLLAERVEGRKEVLALRVGVELDVVADGVRQVDIAGDVSGRVGAVVSAVGRTQLREIDARHAAGQSQDQARAHRQEHAPAHPRACRGRCYSRHRTISLPAPTANISASETAQSRSRFRDGGVPTGTQASPSSLRMARVPNTTGPEAPGTAMSCGFTTDPNGGASVHVAPSQ